MIYTSLIVLLIAFLCCLIQVGSKNWSFWNWTIFVLLFSNWILVVGLRPLDAGNDTPKYVYNYEQTSLDFVNYNSWSESIEPGFYLVTAVMKELSVSPRLYILSIAVFSFLFTSHAVWLVVRYHNLPYAFGVIAYFMFVSTCIMHFGNHLRASVAMPMLFCAVAYALKKRYIATIVWFCLSMLFHNSVVFGVPVLLILLFSDKVGSKRFRNILLIFVGLFVVLKNSINFDILYFAASSLGGYVSRKYVLYIEGDRYEYVGDYASNYFLQKYTVYVLLVFVFGYTLSRELRVKNALLFLMLIIVFFSDYTVLASRLNPLLMFLVSVGLVGLFGHTKEKMFSVLLVFVVMLQVFVLYYSESFRYTLGL